MHASWPHNDMAVGADGTIYLSPDSEATIYKAVKR